MKRITLLGASGSIGRQTLDVMEAFPLEFTLVAFSVGERIHLIDGILSKHPSVTAVCVKPVEAIAPLQEKYPDIVFYQGDDGLIDLIEKQHSDMVVNALVGFVGLAPTLCALSRGIDVALANKEALVVGGPLVKKAQKRGKSKLYPIDSEHVALDKLLAYANRDDVKKLILTASGGSLYHYHREELKHVTVETALAHPTWSMGPKITIDSATMMNKGFEIIEAHYLFDFPVADIDVWIHPTSKIHSMIQLVDGTLLADIGLNNMHIPISYALFRKKRVFLPFLKYSPTPKTIGPMDLLPASLERFPMLSLARRALELGGTAPCALNAANEVAVAAFLAGKLRFDQIEEAVTTMVEGHRLINNPDLIKLAQTDKRIREQTQALIEDWTL